MARIGAIVAAAALVGATLVGTHAAAPFEGAGRPRTEDVRVLAWNIWRGGNGAGPGNLDKLLDQLVDIRPDVYLAVETYGSADRIRQELSKRARRGPYSATKITERPSGSDNLWIFTRYPVEQVYPKPSGGVVSDFNLGGIRVRLPNGRKLNVVDTWITYTDPWVGYLIDENAAGIRAGLTPRHPAQEVVDADRIQTTYLTEVVSKQLPAMLAGNTDPIVMGGDLNTLPAADWTAEWADCPNHLGMSYALRATKVVTDAGFVDTFRAANPDVCADEGRTWSPQPTERLIAPNRIDFIFAKGDVDVERSFVIDEPLRRHDDGVFYSDHAAVVTDFEVRAR